MRLRFSPVSLDPASALAFVPPWLVLALALGVMNAAAAYLLIGHRFGHLAWYALLGAIASGLGQVLAAALSAPSPLQMGELNLVAASAATWVAVLAARLVVR